MTRNPRHPQPGPVTCVVRDCKRSLSEDLFAGWWRLIERLSTVPRVLVWDVKARSAAGGAAAASSPRSGPGAGAQVEHRMR